MESNVLEQLSFPSGLIVREPIENIYRFTRGVTESEIVHVAKVLLGRRVLKTPWLSNSVVAKDFFVTQLSALDYEVFCVAFLNTKHRVIACEPMFRGTLNMTVAYPREVVHRALHWNAAAIMLAHNHPSGDGTPSEQDQRLTQILGEALSLFDIPVLDHFVVAGAGVTSFMEAGCMPKPPRSLKLDGYC